ncbi:predicted protein [Lichtheimia corymbifera JMRC:FSU:9682]|uniref:Uncharacterized protein n=1 Tax=Lichtheimia corymbifera JMRC:FSU:9682 TaxID=1263082 RepID=A0A068RM34_9FUNG|nr:predicted protein [Lichtheimia corymbifera JMRC:FSU:9682]
MRQFQAIIAMQGYQQEDWIISRACGSGLYTTVRLFGLRILPPRMICKLKLKAPRHYFATAQATRLQP